jgi:hypothetical protein
VNGNAGDFEPIYIAAGIDDCWKWMHERRVRVTDSASLRTSLCHEATIMACFAGATVTDQDARKFVYCATARVGMRYGWGFSTADIIPTQRMTLAANEAAIDQNGEFTHEGPNGITLAQKKAIHAVVKAQYDALAATMIPNVIKMSAGLPLIAGVILVHSNGHHFIPPHRTVATALSRQVFGATHTADFQLSVEEFEDAIYHKACHPINTGILVGHARNLASKEKMMSLGLASASVRVPALYPHEKAAGACIRVISEVRQVAASHNVAIDDTAVVSAFEDTCFAAGDQITPSLILTKYNEYVQAENNHAEDIAWCVGYLSAMYEESTQGLASSSLLRSRALRRIRESHPGSSGRGEDWYRTARRWTRNQISSGELPGVGLFGTDAPAARASVNP